MDDKITREYRGYKLLRKYSYKPKILDALIDVSEFCKTIVEPYKYTQAGYREPKAAMLSFSFTPSFVESNQYENQTNRVKPKSEITIFIDSLNKWFGRAGKSRKEANTFKVHFVWVREVKTLSSRSKEWKALTEIEKQTLTVEYEHYHLMCFYDGKKATSKAFGELLHHLTEQGMIRLGGHKVSKENGLTGDESRSKCLHTRYEDLMKHASYLAKTSTKLEKGRNWGKSQITLKK